MTALLKTVPRTIGFGAGLAAVSLAAYSVLGALWGLTRPKLSGQLSSEPGGGYVIDTVADVQFFSFGVFVLVTSVLAIPLGIYAYQASPRSRGTGMLLWVGCVELAAALAFYVFGSFTAQGLPAHPGEFVTWVPGFDPRTGLAFPVFVAVATYWSAAFVSNDDDWEDQDANAGHYAKHREGTEDQDTEG